MKNLTVLFIAITTLICSCNQTSNKEVKETKEEVKEAQKDLQDAMTDERIAVRAKEVAEWNHFRNESDSLIAKIDNDVMEMQAKLVELNSKNRKEMERDYDKIKTEIAKIRQKLHQKNIAFDNDMRYFDESMEKEDELFKQGIRKDLNELDESLKSLNKPIKK